MKSMKRLGSVVLSAALIMSSLISVDASAAKAPKFSKSNVTLKVGESTTLKLKNVSGKTKITWKSKSPKIVKIKKATKKSAKISAVKSGKTSIAVKYTIGKKSKSIFCKVTVKKANKVKIENKGTPTPTPAMTANPVSTSAPATTAPVVSAIPTATPIATPTVAPTEVPHTWVSTWGTAEEKCDVSKEAMPKLPLKGSTVRQIIRVTTSGEKMRLRLSNQYGDSDVTIKSLHAAVQVTADKSTVYTDTDTAITVDGKEEIVIPKGKVITTDEFNLSVEALETVAISAYFGEAPTENITGHRGARATTYQVEGNHVSDETLDSPQKTTSWFFMADASIWSPEGSKAVVCFGDSITDGFGTDAYFSGKKPDSYTRWGDYFAQRLQANEKTKNVSVINEGIGANSILGSYPTDAGKDRFARDLLEHDGVAYCIILFGVNDLNKLKDTSKFDQLLPEYEKMVKLCHDNGIKVYGAPILPFGTNDYYSEASEEVRTMINNWMRSEESGIDGIIDFESALADPDNPINIQEKYTHQDGLHPYDGYDVMADAIDLSLFE